MPAKREVMRRGHRKECGNGMMVGLWPDRNQNVDRLLVDSF